MLDEAISNITLSTTPALTTRERQNADQLGSSGVEVEGDVRPHPRVTLSLFGAFTSAHYHEHAEAAGDSGQSRAAGAASITLAPGVIAETPRVATFSVQARFVGAQFEDDLNTLTLDDYVVVDASATRPITRALHLFLGVENLFDVEYDVARTPVRSIGWPFSVRAGVRVFLP